MVKVRLATAGDVLPVRDLFIAAYGHRYGVPEFYDTSWLTRWVYDDDAVFVVAEENGTIVGTMSALLATGDSDDLQALLGRMVTSPDRQGRGIGTALFRDIVARIEPRVHFAFGEARTAHDGSQKLCHAEGMAAVGYEPMAMRQMGTRESFAVFARTFGDAFTLRRPHPRVIPEAAILAGRSLESLGGPADVEIADAEEGWPTWGEFTLSSFDESAALPLMRIERGRVRGRELFGGLSLALGFFRIAREPVSYIVARQGGVVLGGVGLEIDAQDAHVRIFELIGISDHVRGALLAAADAAACGAHQAAYVDADISAYAPALQCTLARLGYFPVAYMPAMVFHGHERLDVVRMAKLTIPYDPGPIVLRPEVDEVRQLVESQLRVLLRGREIADSATLGGVLHGFTAGELAELGMLLDVRDYAPGDVLLREGDVSRHVLLLLEGSADMTSTSGREAQLFAGEVFGEMALVTGAARSATITARERVRIASLDGAGLARLVDQKPRLGLALMRNLARALSAKVRARVDIRGEPVC